MFIAFEGGDGAGKSTQVELLAQAFEAAGRSVLQTRQPGGTPLGSTLRDLVLHGEDLSARTEALLFAADKAHHVSTMIAPALQAGEVVITDRYLDSAIAYQGAGRELGVEQIASINDWATGGLLPDLTVLLRVPVVEGERRRSGQNQDRMESAGLGFQQVISEALDQLAASDPGRYLVVDGSGSIESVHEAVRRECADRGWL